MARARWTRIWAQLLALCLVVLLAVSVGAQLQGAELPGGHHAQGNTSHPNPRLNVINPDSIGPAIRPAGEARLPLPRRAGGVDHRRTILYEAVALGFSLQNRPPPAA